MASYTAKDITVLQGLEPVRKRPGMYIGGVSSHGLHHLIWEVLDNSVDEAMNGYATAIQLTLHADGSSVTVSDDGRGIPVDKHPRAKKSALEVILTTLHAGGKFEGQNYKTAGGLHGVGASVVNALSSHLVATVKRDGRVYEMKFKAGKPITKLQKKGAGRGTGTKITFHPDPKIFPKTRFNPSTIRERLETTSYLHKGLRITFIDEVNKTKTVFEHSEGIGAYLARILSDRRAKPVHDVPFLLERSQNGEGTRIELVGQWTESTDELVKSHVNGIPTASGGSHENGLRAGLGKAIRNYIETHKLAPKGVTLSSEDIREGLVAVLSIFVTDPQFQGQTKDRFNNPEVQQFIDGAVLTRGFGGGDPQERDGSAADASRKAQRLHRDPLGGYGAVHCRGRLGRRLRQTRTGSRATGGAAASRQSLEYRAGLARENPREQRALRSRSSAWMRSRQEL